MMQIRKFRYGVLCLIAFVFGIHSETIKSNAESAFSELKKMEGRWKIANSNSTFRIDFELTANGTVLIETWLSNDIKKSLTLYHLDGKRLIATHYCPQGNQPRLEMTNNIKPKKIEFEYFDATNLTGINDPHQHYLSFDFSAENHVVERSERYVSSANDGLDIIKLERVPKNDQ